MKRSVQEIVELVVFGAIALLIGTGMLWLVGWIFRGMGWLALAVSGLIWRVLLVLVPIVIVAGLIFWLVNYLMKQRAQAPAAATVSASPEPEPAAAPEADGSAWPAAVEPAVEAAPAEPAVEPTVEPAVESPPAEPTVDSFTAPGTAAVNEGQPELPNTAPTKPVFPFEGQDTSAAEESTPAGSDSDEDRPLRNG